MAMPPFLKKRDSQKEHAHEGYEIHLWAGTVEETRDFAGNQSHSQENLQLFLHILPAWKNRPDD